MSTLVGIIIYDVSEKFWEIRIDTYAAAVMDKRIYMDGLSGFINVTVI